mmetsp:Transcript_18948/g.48092  ORF Transcript_18948/g.48092 Transcript_18948/m.48092 type:complete len:139 (+) Transcript_18948:848-1264(+)
MEQMLAAAALDGRSDMAGAMATARSAMELASEMAGLRVGSQTLTAGTNAFASNPTTTTSNGGSSAGSARHQSRQQAPAGGGSAAPEAPTTSAGGAAAASGGGGAGGSSSVRGIGCSQWRTSAEVRRLQVCSLLQRRVP